MYKIIQCRRTEDQDREWCNQIGETTRIKEARGLVKMNFHSHLEIVSKHEFDIYWDDYSLDEENFTLIGYNSDRKIIYSYKVYYEEQV